MNHVLLGSIALFSEQRDFKIFFIKLFLYPLAGLTLLWLVIQLLPKKIKGQPHLNFGYFVILQAIFWPVFMFGWVILSYTMRSGNQMFWNPLTGTIIYILVFQTVGFIGSQLLRIIEPEPEI